MGRCIGQAAFELYGAGTIYRVAGDTNAMISWCQLVRFSPWHLINLSDVRFKGLDHWQQS